MGFRSALSKPLAQFIHQQNQQWMANPEKAQDHTFRQLINTGKNTRYGTDRDFAGISSYEDFKQRVKVSDYEGLRTYIERIIDGEPDVLWKGKPIYFAKTSGTTSGTKYIPITNDSIPNHINSARNALLSYIYETGNSRFLDGKLMFLSGSPTLDTKGVIPTGRLSGIVNHHIPGYLKTNQMPSFSTNVIEDWELKLDKVIDETLVQNMTLISGIPPWVQMYFDRIIERTGRKVIDTFPNFSVFVYGGVNFKPYERKINESIGKEIDSIETYPASEGFIAYQDSQVHPGLLLLANSGIFFEFIPAEEHFNDNPTRISIHDVELDKNYSLVLNSNAGLWGYAIGDTVKFVSKYPHRLEVTGRVKHFISAFGEHVIGEEVEKSLAFACNQFPEAEVVEFTVAPNVTPTYGLPSHEWFVEFSRMPDQPDQFAKALDDKLCQLNSYYDDLIKGNILQPLRLVPLKPAAFQQFMKSKGKLGGQNKVPRLANDRAIADFLDNFRSTSENKS